MKSQALPLEEFDRLLTHESTEYENLFFIALCRRLRFERCEFELQKNAIFYHRGVMRRPDIYIPRLRLVVEIDGRSHDDKIVVMRSDQSRDPFFEVLGISVLSINTHWVGNNYKRTRTLDDVMRHIRNVPRSEKHSRNTYRKVHYGRVMLAKQRPLIRAGLGECVGILDGNDYSSEFEGVRWYCGVRVFIRVSKNGQI